MLIAGTGRRDVRKRILRAIVKPSFALPLVSSLFPSSSFGNGTPTFTRATTAEQTDFEGKQNLVPAGAARMQGARYVRNFVNNSQVINGNWSLTNKNGTGSDAVATDNYAVDPLGGNTAARLQLNLGAGRTAGDYSGIGNGSGLNAGMSVESIWVKSNTGLSQKFTFTNTNTSANLTATSAWQRFSVANSSGTTNYQITQKGTWTDGNTIDLLIAFLQAEATDGQTNQNPGDYVSVGVLSAPYHGLGADGIKAFDTLNGNSVDGATHIVTEATGAHIDSSQAAAAGGVTAGVVDASGPTGILPEAVRTQYLGVTAAPATQTTASLGTGTYTLWQTGTGSSTSSAGTATITGGGAATAGSPNTFVVTVAGTVTVTVAGAPTTFQLENGAAPSSYIPNAGAAGTSVTRNGDVDQYVSASNLNATAMTVALDWTPEAAAMGTVYMFGTYVDASNYTAILHDGTNMIARKRIGGTNHDATKALTYAAGTAYRIVGRFDSTNGVDVWVAGVKGTGDTTTTASQIGTNFQVGADGNSLQQAFGAIRRFAVYPKGLTDSQAAAL